MTNSRSKASRSSRWAQLVVLAALLGLAGAAHAGKKRVVVLDFEGPKAERFHDDLIKLLRKSHTVVSTDKWNGTAEELEAGTVTARDLKKVARKLGVDAIVEGKIEKRRDEFIIRLKLHDGRTGGLVGAPIDTKAEGPRIDGRAQRELKDELVDAIDRVAANDGDGEPPAAPDKRGQRRDEGDPDDAARPAARPGKSTRKPAEPAESAASDADDTRPRRTGFSKHFDDEPTGNRTARPSDRDPPARRPARDAAARDDDDPAVRKTKPSRGDGDRTSARPKVAARDDDDARGEPGERDAPTAPPRARRALAPGERAVDAVAGLSFTGRTLTFSVRSGLSPRPPNYNGAAPAPGATLDAALYPLAIGHTRSDRLKDLGLNLVLDRVFSIKSKNAAGQTFDSTESRYGLAAVFRYPFAASASAPVAFATLGYTSQGFSISNQLMAGAPSVKYGIIGPGIGIHYPVTPQIVASASARYLLVTGAGAIEGALQYGEAATSGFETGLAIDYAITRAIFVRGALRYESIGVKFKGTGALSSSFDGDPATQDVYSARDRYFGGSLAAGYVY
jgi:TolB-like protein